MYIKIKFGFWVSQPVFHIYDFKYMIFPPGIVDHQLPSKNKYTNFKNIETIVYSQLSSLKKERFINLIKFNYLQNKDNIFSPKHENIHPYFYGHNDNSFISFYNEENFILDLKKGTTIDDKKIISVMTSRPIHIKINNKDKDAVFDAYYVDYLCVDKSFRKKGIAPQMIQTHHYNQRNLNKNIVVSLFKREDELTGIIPLCVYSTYGFSVNNWHKPSNLTSQYKLLQINEQNFYFLYDFINSNNTEFDIIIHTEVTNLIELIKTQNIFIYVVIMENKIISSYFFRKSCVFIEKNMEVLSCFASIKDKTIDENIFIHAFKISFWKIAAENYFGFCAIENISHNNIIIQNISIKTKPIVVSPTAYFFYNFAYPTFSSNKVLILN
jgi:predicted GNAT family acetyltransferase